MRRHSPAALIVTHLIKFKASNTGRISYKQIKWFVKFGNKYVCLMVKIKRNISTVSSMNVMCVVYRIWCAINTTHPIDGHQLGRAGVHCLKC